MISMAGGWFFLMVTEAFTVGAQNYQVPGLGSYMSAAAAKGNVPDQIYAVIAMSVGILAVDRLIWAPLVVWSRKFKLDDFGAGTARQSRFQLWLARSATVQATAVSFQKFKNWFIPSPKPPSPETSLVPPGTPPSHHGLLNRFIYLAFLILMIGLVVWGAQRIVVLLTVVKPTEWLVILRDAGFSFARVLAAMAIGTLWTVPFGIWIGLNPKLASRFQPVIQYAASFPSPMIFSWLLFLVLAVGGSLQWGAVLLILFGTQWYILFNVAGAAAAIPNDMICCAEILRLRGWRRWQKFLIPAVLPGLVTGWITAAGGAWNATVLAEAVTVGPKTFLATGLGEYISQAAAAMDYARLTAASLVMAVIVVVVNRTVWKPLQTIANDRCRFIT